jgi:hypothetical protein|nr:MAG TPA: hypothetical protein [Bacteriophage sp.]
MYKKSSRIESTKQDLKNYIEGYDVFNSILLDKLKEFEAEKEPYIIKTHEFRPDLIAKDIYGDTKYTGLLILTCAVGLESYTKGTVLNIYPKTVIDNLLGSM